MTDQETAARLARVLSLITHRDISVDELARLPVQHVDSVLDAFTERYDRGEKAYRLLKNLRGLTEAPNVGPPVVGAETMRGCIVEAVCKRYGLTYNDLYSLSRKRGVNEPRQVAMYLVRAHTNETAHETARALGRKDHTTVLSAVRAVEKRLAADSTFAERVDAIMELARQMWADTKAKATA